MSKHQSEEELFAAIGLPRKIERNNPSAADYLNGPDFVSFVRKGYRDSTEHGTDEIHRMFETIRIHKPSGVRFMCLSHESYDGQDIEYTLFDPHVITKDGNKLQINSVDLQRQILLSSEGEIPFSAISLDPH